MKKVKVTLNPGPWEMKTSNVNDGFMEFEDFYISNKLIDRIEPLPDYDQWIRDKVPVIGFDGDTGKITNLTRGFSTQDESGEFCIYIDDYRRYRDHYCLYSATAWEKLQNGERPE